MPPSLPESNVAAPSVSEGKQYLFIIRHGDRWDYQNRDWSQTTSRPGDPPLSGLGRQQAGETGRFLNELFSAEGYTADDITWMSSPFLRCLMTSNAAIDALSDIEGSSKMEILPESRYVVVLFQSAWKCLAVNEYSSTRNFFSHMAYRPSLLKKKCLGMGWIRRKIARELAHVGGTRPLFSTPQRILREPLCPPVARTPVGLSPTLSKGHSGDWRSTLVPSQIVPRDCLPRCWLY